MSPITAPAIIPGTTTTNGMNIFGNDAMIGARRAAEIESEAIARCTSTKLVVQYPKESTKPRPNTIPITDHTGLSNPLSAWPGHVVSWSFTDAVTDPSDVVSITLSFNPLQPPTLMRPKIVNGTSAARMTKNCSTSL